MSRFRPLWFRLGRKWGDAGTSTVELALVIPVLLTLMTAAWDFGNALFQQERLASAARAGAQYGLQNSTASTNFAGMTQAARNDANDTNNKLTVTAQQSCRCLGGGPVACGGTCAGNTQPDVYVQVQVSESYTTLFNYPFVANPVPLSSQVMIRVQ